MSEPTIPALLDRAWQALRPGGRLLIHDFMLDDDEAGPSLAALWFLQYVARRVDGISFSAATLEGYLKKRSYIGMCDEVVIQVTTKLIVCVKPVACR